MTRLGSPPRLAASGLAARVRGDGFADSVVVAETRLMHVADLIGVGLLVAIVGPAVVGISRAIRRHRTRR